MKKRNKIIIGALAVTVIISVAYYHIVVNSQGTQNIRYIEPYAEYHSFAEILQHPDLKGKIIYVDYWHTGCGPCLMEFEHVPKVKEHFKGRKDLAFLYLAKDRSVPGEQFRWKRMVEKKNLSGDHFFMTNEMCSQLWSETVSDTLITKSFPHYLIVGRDGKIINNNAPRPSDDLLVAELTQALSQ